MKTNNRSDVWQVCRKSRYGWDVLNTWNTKEEAEADVSDLHKYAWRPNEEIVIFRLSYHPEILVKASVTLESKKL